MSEFMRQFGLAAVALALPMAADAAPLIEGGGNTDLYPHITYNYDATLDLPAGTNTFTFAITPKGSPGSALTATIALGEIFSDASFVITGSGGPFLPDSETLGPGFYLASFSTIPFVTEMPYVMTLMFDLASATKDADVNVEVQVVPLPAAGLLLLGAFGALGLAARRRRPAA